ncbi:hypothetical protein [uncultured Gilvimarinus sp.]|uniref:hypothetical protein n=1 Tax=uncultured Gilvimarinus sp. TaxID=1689143 RepID=UPI0030ED2AD2
MSELGALELDTELALLLSEDSALLEALAGVELLTIELLESELSPSELLLERLLETELFCGAPTLLSELPEPPQALSRKINKRGASDFTKYSQGWGSVVSAGWLYSNRLLPTITVTGAQKSPGRVRLCLSLGGGSIATRY